MNKKILIVDDDAISLKVLATFLQAANYAYLQADDGKAAWKLLEENSDEIALVIADRIMPGLHGVDLLAKMQQHVVLNKVPFVMLTGEAEKEEVLAAIKAGVTDFLYKPVSKQLLLAVVERLLQAKSVT